MDQRFAESYFYARHRLLSRELKPFCLLHWIQLEALGSPIPDRSERATLSDFWIAAQICSRSEVLSADKIRDLPMRSMFWDVEAAFFRWQAFMADSAMPPKFWRRPSNFDRKVPWQIATAVHVARELHTPCDEIMLWPMSKVWVLQAVISEANTPPGKQSPVMSEDDERQISEARTAAPPQPTSEQIDANRRIWQRTQKQKEIREQMRRGVVVKSSTDGEGEDNG